MVLESVAKLLNVVHTFIGMCVLAGYIVVSVVQKRGDALQHACPPVNQPNNVLGADYKTYMSSNMYNNYPL
jgi:hypothetical protein